ncbi:MAG: DUF1345 domain-containing protein [Altererythrobacter sp.]|nr:DUF1345 domain-containing protein [Altererythrobacter sp.]
MMRGASQGEPDAGIGNRLAPARFLVFLVLLIGGFFVWLALSDGADWRDGAVVAFDAAAAVFLISLIPLLRDSDAAAMRLHAARNDANRLAVLGLTTLLTIIAMAAITGEMKGAQAGEPMAIARLVGTLLLIWLFANGIFTLHYAHAFYLPDESRGGDAGGLDFPGTDTPDYWDFAYFAFTLGMTFQTSDVDVRSRTIRKVALFHSFGAFVFNIGVIAFTINVLGGG